MEKAMSDIKRIHLIGGTASPYTRKMLALLRYRHIPYKITWGQPELVLPEMGIENPKPVLLPVFVFTDEQGNDTAVCDSTPIIRRLEGMQEGRSVLPQDPAIAFIDYLLEDFGDEWCTKYMFHYRWHFEVDAENAGTLLPLSNKADLSPEEHAKFKAYFSKRQIDRLYVVGSNDTTAPIIDASYRRLLGAFERHFEAQRYFLGGRPGAGDFAIYGQLTQLVGYDPTPRAIAHEVSPRTVAWVDCTEDLSGLPDDETSWNDPDYMPATLKPILEEVGNMYVPTLLANAKALQAGEKSWQIELDGARWTQQTFPYQAKCLRWINEQYSALADNDRRRVDAILAGTGCEAVILSQN